MSQSTFPDPEYSRHVLQPAYVDAQSHLFVPMLDAHEAHTVVLADSGIITVENAAAILTAVAQIRADGIDALAYRPGVEDLFFRIESQIIEVAGTDYGGNLQLARSRNDLGQALARMALRHRLLLLYAEMLHLRQVIHELAQRHLDTLMPGYTHTQPAQPVTFAHYLAGVLTFLGKDQARLAAAYTNINESPLGAAAFTGTGFPINRRQLADLLGFDAVITSTHHSIGAADHLTDSAFAIASLAIGLSRVTKDLLFLATQEAGALHIHDSFIQISSIMPQKRNPVVLEHLRARLSRALGAAHTIAIQCHNIPYGDTQDIEDEILPPTLTALDTVQACISLYSRVFATLELHTEHLHQRAAAGFTTATELADTLVREAGLPFRLAHKVTAIMVQTATDAGIPSTDLHVDMLQTAAREVLGHELTFSAEQFARALNPEHFVAVRNGPGGVAPEATALLLDELLADLLEDRMWLDAAERRLAQASHLRQRSVKTLLDTN